MSAIDSSRVKFQVGAAWAAFALINATLMYASPGAETIPYHLIWASFALVYGLTPWSLRTTIVTFSVLTIVTGIALAQHASEGFIGWEETAEVPLMGVIAALLVWHVRRHHRAQRRIVELHERDRARAAERELATRFGSHELRTRLTIVRSVIDLTHDLASDHRTREDTALALRELDKATTLSTGLMTFVGADATPMLEPVDLDVLVRAIVRRWGGRVDRVFTEQAWAGSVLADAGRLETAIDCLIENAVKFTTAGGSIRIGAASDGTGALLWVEDDGDGIPAGEIGLVTELFHVGRDAGVRAGSGIGLAIVRAIVTAHHGTVDIASSEGRGTYVAISLPRGAIIDPLPVVAETTETALSLANR